MGQDGAWAGHLEIYAAVWCYKVDITIYSKDYTALGGSLVFKSAGMTDEFASDRAMIYISYHDNTHFNNVRPPLSSQSNSPVYLNGAKRIETDMERAINDHQDEFGQAITMATTENGSMFPKEKINPIRENSWKIMSYIACQLSVTNGQCVSEAQLKQSRNQAEEHALGKAQKDVEVAPTPQDDPTLPSALSPLQVMVAQYEAEPKKTISNHQDGVLIILREVLSHEENLTILASQYEELHCTNFLIMTGLANLIMHLGGEEISYAGLSILADRAEEVSKGLPTKAAFKNPSAVAEEKISPNTLGNVGPLLPPTKPKTSLKPSKFFPVFADQTPPCQTEICNKDDGEEEDKPGMYSKLDEGVGDGTNYITASFVKSNNEIKDQLLMQVRYFLDLMSANIDGVKFHPLNTERSLSILTMSTDKNFPTTGTKIRDYFHIQNKISLILGTRNIPKVPPQKLDADGQFQFNENRVYDGPDRITGIMLISAPCNVKQAISNLLIELEGYIHQIHYKPTQQKNSKTEKMFPGVPAVLCPEGLMQSIRHGLKKCEKALCNEKKFSINANMIQYNLPLLIMNGYFKQVTPPKAPSDSESKEHSLNKISEFKKNGCKMLVIEYDPIDNQRMAPVWALFMDSGEMERILGIRVKLQVIPPPGERDPNSITKNQRYCKHHIIYSSKVQYVQHKTVINLDHAVTLAMRDGSAPPCTVSTLHHEYFDLESKERGHIIYGVFVRMESKSVARQ